MIAYDKLQMYNSHTTAKYALECYFFHQKPIIEFQKLEKRFERTEKEYEVAVEETFRDILIQSPHALEKIDHIVDVIAEIHYGNWQAVLMRIMAFTGDLTSKLQKYNLLHVDFFQIQDELQVKISSTSPPSKRLHSFGHNPKEFSHLLH